MIALAVLAVGVALGLAATLAGALAAHWLMQRIKAWASDRFMVPPGLRKRL